MTEIIKNPVIAIAVFSSKDESGKTYHFQPIIKSTYLSEFAEPISIGRGFRLESIVPLNCSITEVVASIGKDFIPLGYDTNDDSVCWEDMARKKKISLKKTMKNYNSS